MVARLAFSSESASRRCSISRCVSDRLWPIASICSTRSSTSFTSLAPIRAAICVKPSSIRFVCAAASPLMAALLKVLCLRILRAFSSSSSRSPATSSLMRSRSASRVDTKDRTAASDADRRSVARASAVRRCSSTSSAPATPSAMWRAAASVSRASRSWVCASATPLLVSLRVARSSAYAASMPVHISELRRRIASSVCVCKRMVAESHSICANVDLSLE
mmetsp:Transcript_8970/g.27823  ORF Transcript_8970/g.27823 Transcript_8970/m.27823 type:complete len:220 (+) Transcript_8970:238-897(+)